MEALLTVALVTEMQRGELLDPNWRDLDLQQGDLLVAFSMDRVAGHCLVESKFMTVQS